jgi:CheY-like chemotaxis protein/anti-sigma regulatory factor (Ser/Thr protein kinase)
MLIRPLADARGIAMHFGAAEPALAVYADQQRLRQVLINLASNAVKYNHHGGMIEIGYRLADPDHVDVAVSDTGPGLSAHDIERIFVPFERLDAEQHGIEGTGIGLPLALALTEAMGGTLTVAGVPGRGSTFTVRLPRATDLGEAAESAGPPAAAAVSTGSGPLVVLSIEDNAANAALLERLISQRRETTLHAAVTAQAGIDLAQRCRPDIILLDLHLPDLPGEEAFARLRAEPATAEVPIVVLSADATPGSVRRLLARGAAAYLTKPLDLTKLHAVLDEVTGAAAAPPATQTSRR